MLLDVRSEKDGGKLLFRWSPTRNIIKIVYRDHLYTVLLDRSGDYRVISKVPKKEARSE